MSDQLENSKLGEISMFLKDFQSLNQSNFLHTYPCPILIIQLIYTVWTVKQGYRKKPRQP